MAEVMSGVVRIPKSALDWLNGAGPDANGHWFGDAPDDAPVGRAFWWRDKFRALIEAGRPEVVDLAGVEVKPLEWGKTSYGRPEVDTIVGVYRVFEHQDGGWAATLKTFNLVDPHGRKNFATKDEALAAVEADYRERILSALSLPAQEPVAWVADYKKSDGSTDHFVMIGSNGRAMSLHMHRIRGRAEYEAAEISHVLTGTPKPEFDAFDVDGPTPAVAPEPPHA